MVIKTSAKIKRIQKELGRWKEYYNQELSKVKTLQAACAEKDARIAELYQKLANLEELIDKLKKEEKKKYFTAIPETDADKPPEPWRRGVRQ